MNENPVNQLGSADPGPNRKERRIRVRLPVEVRGIDRSGVRFNERTESTDLCRQGAAFVLSRDLELGADLDILIPLARPAGRAPARATAEATSGDFATQARVRHVRSVQDGSVIGVEFIGSHFHRVFLSESVEPD